MNFFDILGIPSEFGVLLLTLSLILLLSPYFSDADFGVIKIPKLKAHVQKGLKIVGPLIMLISLLLYFPIWTKFLFPVLNSSSSPIVGQSLRIGASGTNYRIEITVKNASTRDDRLIDHVEIVAHSRQSCVGGGAQSFIPLFTISDKLLVQPDYDNNRLNIQGEMTQGQDTNFVYKVYGELTGKRCRDQGPIPQWLTLSFDTSIAVPKDSSVQFYVLLPRDLKISSTVSGTRMDPGFDFTGHDVLKDLPDITVSIWDSEAERSIEFESRALFD
jgi:hypothetical protein